MKILAVVLTATLTVVSVRAADTNATPAAPAPAPALPAEMDPNEVVARVNGDEIKRKDLMAAEQAFLGQMMARGQRVPPGQMARFEHDVLDELIGRQLVLQEGRKRKVADLDKQVEEEFKKIKAARGGDEGFVKALKDASLTEAELRGHIRDGLILRDTMEATLAGKNDVAADEIQRFYDSQKERFQQPEQVRASHILVRVNRDASETDKAAARAAIGVARDRLVKGEKFEAVAKDVSQDPGSAATGGDLGFFGRGAMVPEFEEAAFTLKTNELSEVVSTQFGFHVLKVTDRKPAREVPLAEVKEDIERFLRNRKSAELAAKHVQELRGAAKVEVLLKEPAPVVAPAPGTPPITVTPPPVAAPTK